MNHIQAFGVILLGVFAVILATYVGTLLYEQIEQSREICALQHQIKIEQLKTEIERMKHEGGERNDETMD